ncbi:hypothetical protein [Thalassococcus halodurans]|uniref:hypothetical protein n=1 Tax=Thalassococcus halodurans TaxID=373675 RepID=UPI00135A93F9|nr:hypothetical protein [Thalassococcus halodurans]
MKEGLLFDKIMLTYDHQSFDRISHIMGLVDHMRQVQTSLPFGIDQFVQNQKQVILFNGATIQSIVATLNVVEMEPGKLACMDPPRHNHFDIHV